LVGVFAPAHSLAQDYSFVSNLRAQQRNPDLSATTESPEVEMPGKKSSFLAAVLSLAIPGLGEYYVGDHVWRGMIFTGLEIGLWAERIHWTHRGDDSTTAFRAFSDAHWSTCRYGDSLNSYLRADSIGPIAICGNFHSVNLAEAALDSVENARANIDPYASDNHTHRLVNPADDVQQYYELISKYTLQYLPGWDNFTNFNRAGAMRTSMNDQYGVADDFLYAIFVNHVLSAIDAALLASDHNSRIHLQGSVVRRPRFDGTMGYMPTANLELTF